MNNNQLQQNNQGDLFVGGVSKNDSSEELAKSIEQVFLRSTNHLEWLSEGDTVLLKPALNSPDPYPATTHPLSVKVVANVLQKRGAKVIVGDQSGVEHVLQGSSGAIKGSTKDNFEKSGMVKSGVEFTGFESRGWDGFFNFKSKKTPSWKDGFYLTDLIQKVDHIINLPRLSTHIQAGVTLGFKNMVGLLRDDSRVEFHQDGPFRTFFNGLFARKLKLSKKYHNENIFFEKIVEISSALEDKLRLTLFVGTKAQLTIGPDKRNIPFAPAFIAHPETGLVFASSNQVATEVFAIAYLRLLYLKISTQHKLFQKFLMFFNGQVGDLESEKVWDNKFIQHALKIGLGDKNFETKYEDVPRDLVDGINNSLEE